MKKITLYTISVLLIFGLMFTSCLDDLDTVPLSNNEKVGETVYGKDLLPYKQSLAKIYAGLAISGNAAGDGDADVEGVDGGSQASFLRGLWNLQELPSDEAHCNWGDVGIPELNNQTFGTSNVFIKGLYYRLIYQVSLVNQFLRETTDNKLDSRGVEPGVKAEIHYYREEARFNRALAYYYLLDLFRNVPFTTEESVVGSSSPEQIKAKDLFAYIEKELLDCKDKMLDSFVGYNNKYYGRANKAAAWSLLSRLYLNAEIYTGTPRYTESITYSKLVMEQGYQLEPIYADVFKADNDHSNEMIFPIRYEGSATQTWGGMTFVICSTVPSALQVEANVVGAWQGNRARSSLLTTFEKQTSHNEDSRKDMLKTDMTASNQIIDPSSYADNGIPVIKFVNVNKDGTNPPSNIVYTDFPLFRLGEIYLNYAEAVLRGGTGGDKSTAVTLVNNLRERAYKDKSKATVSDITLDFILDERGRELFFEAQRRTDLVRFGKFTGSSYVWEWKGGTAAGTSTQSYLNVYPIPADDIGSNLNLDQNEGYK